MIFCPGHYGILMTTQYFQKWDFEGQLLYPYIEAMLLWVSSEANEKVMRWKLITAGQQTIIKRLTRRRDGKYLKPNWNGIEGGPISKLVLGNDTNTLERKPFSFILTVFLFVFY